MKLKRDWLWDKKISIEKARAILKKPNDGHFLSLAGTLLSRKNTPKEVFKYYLKPINFVRNWPGIKRQMRKDNWNDPRIEYWQAIYEAVKEKYEKKGVSFKKEIFFAGIKDVFCKTIGDKIRSARKEKGYTQSVLAAKLKISQQIISRIENGRANISLVTLKKIADVLEAPLRIELGKKSF